MEKQLESLSAAVAHLRSDTSNNLYQFKARAIQAIEAISEILKVLQSPLVSEAKLEELKKHLGHLTSTYPDHAKVFVGEFNTFGEKLMEVFRSISVTDPQKKEPEEFLADKYKVVENGQRDFRIYNQVTGDFTKQNNYGKLNHFRFATEDEARDYCEALNIGHKLRSKREGATT